jgi:hypothetical protein
MTGVRRGSTLLIFAAALCASASAACSLLTAAAVPVMLVWCVYESKSSRVKTGAAFIAGSMVPFLPVARLAFEGPRQVLFNLVQYQTLYRATKWDGASEHDFGVLFSVTGTPAAVMLILLAAAGVWFAARNTDVRLRSELYLSTAVGVAICAELATAHPTFERYFMLATPFLAIPAAVGFVVVGSKLHRADRPWPLVAGSIAIAAFGLVGQLYEERDAVKWTGLEKVAEKVNQVTSPGAAAYLDEPTFYLSRRPLPDGMEFSHSHKLELSEDRNKLFHIIPQAKIDEMVAKKIYATVETCDDDEVDRLSLKSLYSEHETVSNCDVFWHLK